MSGIGIVSKKYEPAKVYDQASNHHHSLQKPKNLRAIYGIDDDEHPFVGGSVPRKPKKKAPVLVSNADRMPSLDRLPPVNQSGLNLKLPEIKIAHYHNLGGHSREHSLNYDDKQERLRHKLEMLYHIRAPKYKSLKNNHYYDNREPARRHKPPLVTKKHAYANSIPNIGQIPPGSYLVAADGGVPASRP